MIGLPSLLHITLGIDNGLHHIVGTILFAASRFPTALRRPIDPP